MTKFLKNISTLLLATILFYSCSDDASNDPIGPIGIADERGEIVSIGNSTILSETTIQFTINAASQGADVDFEPTYGVEIIELIYKTIDAQGNLIDASGVVVKPIADETFPLISVHHGTQTKKDAVGSENYFNAFEGIIAASVGYVASQPDYLGFGVSSDMFHPYLHEETSASSSIDMIRATKQYCEENGIQLNDQLYLAGYSQGGYVTMAAHKEIERNLSNEFIITASAPMAGPHDLLGTALFVTQDNEYPRPSFISFIVLAYNDVYQWDRIDDIFKDPYNTIAPSVFEGNLTTGQIDNQLTTNLADLFKDDFLSGIRNRSLNYIIDSFVENSLQDWAPVAPITLIHGNADTYVPYENAVTTQNILLGNGGSFVDLVTIDGGTHETSILPAFEYTLNWFNTFREGNLPKIKLVR
jgi:predicted esterase